MAIASNLGNLLHNIEKQYYESYNELKDFKYIPVVESFLVRREKDLLTFKKITSGYSISSSVLSVKADLETRFPKNSKYYGGICLKGADYFKITKKVRKAVEEEIDNLNEQAWETSSKEDMLYFDKDYCIPDELDEKNTSIIYE